MNLMIYEVNIHILCVSESTEIRDIFNSLICQWANLDEIVKLIVLNLRIFSISFDSVKLNFIKKVDAEI